MEWICPICKEGLEEHITKEDVLVCFEGHTFKIKLEQELGQINEVEK